MQPRIFDPTVPAQRTVRSVVSIQNTGEARMRFGVQVTAGEDRPLVGFLTQTEAAMVTTPFIAPGQTVPVTVFIPLPEEPGDKTFVVSVNEIDTAGRFVRELDTRRFLGLASILAEAPPIPVEVPPVPVEPPVRPPPRFNIGDRAGFADGRNGIITDRQFNPNAMQWQYFIEGIGGFFLESDLFPFPEPEVPGIPLLLVQPNSTKRAFDAQRDPIGPGVPLSVPLNVPQGGRLAVELFFVQTTGTPQRFRARQSIIAPADPTGRTREVFTTTPTLVTTSLNTPVAVPPIQWNVPSNAVLGLYTMVFDDGAAFPAQGGITRITFSVVPVAVAPPVTPVFLPGDIILESATGFEDIPGPPAGFIGTIGPAFTSGQLAFLNPLGKTGTLSFTWAGLGPAGFSTPGETMEVSPDPGRNTLPITLRIPPEAPTGPYGLQVQVDSEGQRIASMLFPRVFEVLAAAPVPIPPPLRLGDIALDPPTGFSDVTLPARPTPGLRPPGVFEI